MSTHSLFDSVRYAREQRRASELLGGLESQFGRQGLLVLYDETKDEVNVSLPVATTEIFPPGAPSSGVPYPAAEVQRAAAVVFEKDIGVDMVSFLFGAIGARMSTGKSGEPDPDGVIIEVNDFSTGYYLLSAHFPKVASRPLDGLRAAANSFVLKAIEVGVACEERQNQQAEVPYERGDRTQERAEVVAPEIS